MCINFLDAPIKTVGTPTVNPKYKRKHEIKGNYYFFKFFVFIYLFCKIDFILDNKSSVQNTKRIPLQQTNVNKLSNQQKQENLQNLHYKTKLLLKNNLERKKISNSKINENEPKNISNPIKNEEKETYNTLTDENTVTKTKVINNVLQNAHKVNSGIVKKKNISRIQKEKINGAKKNQSSLKNTTDLIQNIDNINKNTLQTTIPDVQFSQKLFDYPYNFISAVKNKLSMTVNSPRRKNNKLLSSPLSKPASKLVQNVKNQEVSVVTADKPNDGSNGISQVSNIISDLKSSLSEIQNLTLSISFHDIRTCQCPEKSNNDKLNGDNGKNEEKAQSFLNSIMTDNNNPIPVLTPPNCVLTPSKSYMSRAMTKNIIKEEKNNFHKELSLLDSFNESLNHIQKVDEVCNFYIYN